MAIRQVERPIAKVKYIWRIVPNNNLFIELGEISDKLKYWHYETRELAEQTVMPFVEKYHKDYVAERIWYSKTAEGKEELDEEERKWWRAKPPLNILREKTKTIFLCGEPD